MSKKQIIFTALGALLIIAIVTAVVANVYLYKNNDNNKKIIIDGDAPIDYGAVNQMIFYKKISDILEDNFYISDKNNKIGNILLDALSKARIPAAKAMLFADYFAGFFALMIKCGFSPADGQFNLEEITSGEEIFSDFIVYLTKFSDLTGLTEIELGRFMYELILANFGNEEYKILFASLGKEDFVELTANTIYCYQLVSEAVKEGSGAAEARALQAIVYSMGSTYTKIIDRIGISGLETILGFDYDLTLESTALEQDEIEIFQATLAASEGKIGNIIDIAGEIMKNTDAYTFELIFEYAGLDDKTTTEANNKLITSHIRLADAIKEGIEESFGNNAITNISSKDEFISGYTTLLVQYKKFFEMTMKKAELTDYDAYTLQVSQGITDFLDCVYALSGKEDIDLSTLSAEEYNDLVVKSKGLWKAASGTEDYLNESFSIMLLNFFLRAINIKEIITNNKPTVEELFQDYVNGLITRSELEDIIELYY